MSMIDTSDTDKGDSNQEVTKPEKVYDAEYQGKLAEVLRKDKEATPIDFKMKLNFRYPFSREIEIKQKNALATSHIYSEPISKITIQLLDS